MAFIISAKFLMDTYQGSDETGQPERYPSPERLYKALVAVAYSVFAFGENAAVENGADALSQERIGQALQWFEQNPPDAIKLPDKMRNGARDSGGKVVFRDRGSWNKKEKRSDTKSVQANIATAYDDTVGGTIAWQWQTIPNKGICDTFAKLCYEVPYLGEACSPVKLTAFQANAFPQEKSLLLDPNPLSLSHTASGLEFQVPSFGHLRELQEGYDIANPQRKSRPSGSEEEKTVLSNTLTQCVRRLGYIRPIAESSGFELPWGYGVFISAELEGNSSNAWEPRDSELVAWSVALHRLLVRQIGRGASPILTGKYDSVLKERPANNLSIHVLGPDVSSVAAQYRNLLPGFLVMLPQNTPVADMSEIISALESVSGHRLYFSSHNETLRLTDVHADVDLVHFWKPAEPGQKRFWSPWPFCVRETRPIPDPQKSRRWGARENIALSIGHVWRDYFTIESKNDRELEYWELVDAVMGKDSPVGVYGAHSVMRPQMADYVHKIDHSNTLMGATALIRLPDVCNEAVAAIGQTRHVGGGLLIPCDMPEQVVPNIVGRR